MNILARASEWTKASPGPLRDQGAGRRRHHYFAFLSYSHKDEAAADWLHDALERFRVPSHLVGKLTEHGVVPRRLTPIFRDLGELPASDDLGAEICEAIAASRFLIVLCSPAAARSRWTNAEIEAFKRARPDGCILAAVVEGEPFASNIDGREAEECLPRALRFKYDRRGRATSKPAEPLAADLRGDSEAKRLGVLKLIAGLLGLGLDDLVQREAMRRQKRLAIIAAASLAGMAVTSALAFTAIQARDSARDERREAESLVGFMLGDLRTKLEPVGRLDALDGVGERVLAYYRKQDRSELSDSSLSQRSRALALMGEVAYLRGDFDGADRLYREAMAGTGEAVRRNSSQPQLLYDHAQNVFWTGAIARIRGRTADAEAASREYKKLAEQMIAIEPDNIKWRMEVQYAAANLGIVLYRQRRFAEADRQFDQALRTIEALAVADPANVDNQKSLSESLAWLADARIAQGRIGDAIALRRRQVALLQRHIGAGDVAFREKAIPAYQALGRLLTASGDSQSGTRHLQMSVRYADELIPAEPTNTKWQGLAASSRLALADQLLAAGNTDAAAEQSRSACDTIRKLIDRDPKVAEWRGALRNCLTSTAELQLQRKSYAQSRATARAAFALAGLDGSDLGDTLTAARLRHVMGDAAQQMGDLPGARAEWEAGLAALPAPELERPSEMALRARLLDRLGRGAEARSLTSKLSQMGIRTTS